jgi:hypothetical protein
MNEEIFGPEQNEVAEAGENVVVRNFILVILCHNS